MKPRIVKLESVYGGYYWACMGGGKAGSGKTPKQAYLNLVQELMIYAVSVIPANKR